VKALMQRSIRGQAASATRPVLDTMSVVSSRQLSHGRGRGFPSVSKRIVNFIVAPPLVLGGLWFILLPFAFARLRFADPNAHPGWGEYLTEVLTSGLVSFSIGIGLITVGMVIASNKIKPIATILIAIVLPILFFRLFVVFRMPIFGAGG
jgi:hypothetical protein